MLDESVIPPATPKPKPALWKRVLAWTFIVGMYALLLGMLWFAISLFSSAIKPGVPWEDRLYKLLEAGALLVIPAKVAWTFIKRKLATGSWLRMTEQEKARIAARRSARQCGTTKANACRQASQSLILFVFSWAGYMAWNENAAPWKRALAWTVIVLHVLSGIALGLLFIGGSFADGLTPRQHLLWILTGLACSVYPAIVIRSYLRRFQTTGTLRVSREEFESVTAQRREAQNKQRQIPLRSKIVSYAIGAAALGLMWVRATVYHSRHPHESWVTPAFFTIPLLYSIWKDFAKPRTIQP